MREVLVCVGGPYDGRRVQIGKSQNFLYIAAMAKPTFTDPVSLDAAEYCHFIYRRIVYQAGPGITRMFLAPNADTPEETLNRLIDGYRQPVSDRPQTGR